LPGSKNHIQNKHLLSNDEDGLQLFHKVEQFEKLNKINIISVHLWPGSCIIIICALRAIMKVTKQIIVGRIGRINTRILRHKIQIHISRLCVQL
jgi:hypothetical protein